MTIQTSITINANASKVWDILMQTALYPEWNPLIKRISGSIAEGEKIEARIEPPNSAGMTFKPMILSVKSEKELRWKGKLLFKGLFDGEHQFLINDHGNGSLTFEQNEIFTGVLVKIFPKRMFQNTKLGFEQMNAALKLRAEGLN